MDFASILSTLFKSSSSLIGPVVSALLGHVASQADSAIEHAVTVPSADVTKIANDLGIKSEAGVAHLKASVDSASAAIANVAQAAITAKSL